MTIVWIGGSGLFAWSSLTVLSLTYFINKRFWISIYPCVNLRFSEICMEHCVTYMQLIMLIASTKPFMLRV